jgi:hypothetical protein
MSERTLPIDGIRVPRFLYGTAWKEDETRRLVELALRHGFRGIDTANQRKRQCLPSWTSRRTNFTKTHITVRITWLLMAIIVAEGHKKRRR